MSISLPKFYAFALCCWLGTTLAAETNNTGPEQYLDFRIIGGDEAEPRQFKYHVYLETGWGFYLCGGGIIGDRYVLTAAHCVIDTRTDRFYDHPLRIVAGTDTRLNASSNDHHYSSNGAVVLAVEQAYVPYMYRSSDIGDIALLKLNGSLGLATNPNLRALELPRDQLLTYDDEEVLISGFGITWLKYYMAPSSSSADGTAAPGHQSPAVVDGELSARLRYARADVIPTQACRKIYKRRQPVYYVQICTRLRQREYSRPEGVCVGDSGGPVVHNNRTIVGVVSRGPLSCSELVVPARHTRVSPFVRFIDHAVHGTHDPDMMARVHNFL
ncbi:trypsin-like [Trichogramma pretiosum]|uniref:trypsin-like n=1 Tax=Trichogramma pretiosum TaxID=7493 RepID=UPI0006C946DE|nr:trypsin-like [Trichogramma pretiosum]